MAVNLIDNEEIHVNQDGSDITLEIQADALKNKDVIVGSIRTKNMLNSNELMIGTVSATDGSYSYMDYVVVSNFTKVKANTTYTIKLNNITNSQYLFRIVLYTTNKTYNSTITTRTEYTQYSFTPTIDGYIRICFGMNGYSVLTPSDIIITNPQLEEGDTATTFSPYQNLNLEIKNKYVSGTPDSNGFISTGLDVNNIIIGVAGINQNAGFFTPFIEKNANRLTIQCKTWNQNPITTSVSFTVYYIEI